MTPDDAIAAGAMALFGEKYGDEVRMVTIEDYSKELCGGTHCNATGEVGAFLVARESSTAAGIRRIEALTGRGALEYMQGERKLVEALTSTLKISSDEVLQRVQELLDRNKKLEKEVERLKEKGMMGAGSGQTIEIVKIGNKQIGVAAFEEASLDQVGRFVDETAKAKTELSAVIGFVLTGETAIRSASEELDAAALFKKVFGPDLGGRGGGRKDFAKGKLEKIRGKSLQEAINSVVAALNRHLS